MKVPETLILVCSILIFVSLLSPISAQLTSVEYNDLALTKFYSGEIKKACGLFQKALDREPKNLQYLVNSAACRLRFGVETSQRMFQEALKLDPTYESALNYSQDIETLRARVEQIAPLSPLDAPRSEDWHLVFEEPDAPVSPSGAASSVVFKKQEYHLHIPRVTVEELAKNKTLLSGHFPYVLTGPYSPSNPDNPNIPANIHVITLSNI